MREKRISELTISLAMIQAIVATFSLAALALFVLGWGIGVERVNILQDFLSTFSGVIFFLVKIFFLILIFIFLVMFVCWLRKDEDGMMILPFDVATGEDGYSGKAISDLLTAELRRIKRIHEVEAKKIHSIRLEPEKITETETLVIPPVVPRSEKLDYKVAEVGAVQVGPTGILIGPLLSALKQLWPGSDTEQVMTGSLQKYGSVINLVARLEHHEVRAWEVRHKIKPQDGVRDEQIPIMVRDLAFKIAKDLSSKQDGQANTWQGFKYFTEAWDAYYQYSLTEDEGELERAKESCLLAAKSEIGYEMPFNLLYYLGVTYLDKEKYAVAERILKQALEIKSDHVLALVMLGDVHFAQNNPEDGLKCYYKAKYIDPKCASDWMGKGIALGRLRNYKEVLECFDKATSLDPKYASAWFNKGIALGWLERYEEALDCFDKAVSLDPKNPMFLYNKGVSLKKLDRKEEALECFDEVSTLDPKFDFDWIKEGDVFMKSGAIKTALKYYEKAIIYNQKIVPALTKKGWALRHLGEIEQAFRCYRIALDIDPGYTDAGFGLMILGRNDLARKCFDNAISQNQKDANAWRGRGTVLRILNKDDEAIKCFKKALEYNPVSSIDYISLAAVYRKLGGREDERTQTCEKAQRFLGWPEYNRACFEAVCGSPDVALTLLRTALEKKEVLADWARRDPDLEFIRDDPRFAALLDEFSAGGEKGPE